MGFNKRYISKESLEIFKSQSVIQLIGHILRPDCLIIEDDYSEKICNIIRETKNKTDVEKKLIQIGFYES